MSPHYLFICTIDESVIEFKECSTWKEYFVKKPRQRRYKVWMRFEEFGFDYEFDIYTGKTENLTENYLSETDVKKSLHRQKNHKLFMDNFLLHMNCFTLCRIKQYTVVENK